MRFRASLLGSLVLSLGLLCSSMAAGQEPATTEDKEAVKRARDQFTQALSLQTAGDWAGALTLLKEVATIKPTPQVRFNIALCEEKLGRLVAALGDYELAAVDARESDAGQVAQEVDARLESLKARIPKIVVQRGAGAENATIMLDGVAIGDSLVGAPIPADPGPHVVDASATGFKSFKQALRLQETQTETVTVVLEPIPEGEKVALGGPSAQSSSSATLRTVGIVTTGVGAASLIASGVFFYLRGQTINDLDSACPDRNTCPESERSTFDKGKTYNTVGNVTLAIGAVAVAAGIPMIVLGSSSSETAVRLVPAAAGAHAGASFAGRF
ncbi:MAG TPA: hypothetical protein VM686_09270 [Polyangiaceae bacterium]|nr:hypothetical protein [Polyangiaceae bacterium]